MLKKYQVRDEIPEEVLKSLSKYRPITRRLLFNRGITDEVEAEKFFNPNYERDLNDPFLLKDIDKACERILKAIKEEEKILIYSDYDADGIPGAVILHDFFTKIGFKNFENYIPHRNDEGFGLNIEAVKDFAKRGFDLIITVDCGINDVKEVEEANKLGLDVIITDHHLPGSVLPKAFAIVNPNQEGDKYPFKSLCGSAVAFKLVQALISKGDFNIISGWDKWLLDLVGLATISDMVSLTGENRALSYYGLLVLRKTKRLGLKKLYKETKIQSQHLSEDDISFVITPRINAASRMDEAQTAFELLSATDEPESIESAQRLSKLNNERKILTANIVKEIKRKFSKKEDLPPVIVSGNPKWIPSILGIVAGNLAEEFSRPVFLWGRNGNDEIKGSCRSDQKTDIFALMHSLPEGTFSHFGGHKFSGGFGVANDKIHFLEEEIIKCFKEQNGHKEKKESENIFVDSELGLEDINWEIVDDISKFSPYGIGNEKPIFLFKEVVLPEIKKFGKNNEHLKIDFQNREGKNISAISFFSNEESFSKVLKEGEEVDLVASIEKSFFRNYPEIRLRIIDIV